MAKPAVPPDATVFDLQAQLNAAAAAQSANAGSTPPDHADRNRLLLTRSAHRKARRS
jgi:hypothetical protein